MSSPSSPTLARAVGLSMTDHGWRLNDLAPPTNDAPTVFSCFHCGGGSTMGYKLAGYRVLGGVEIDPRMMSLYRRNHHPALSYLMGVQEFAKLPDADIPAELRRLDILDGSPPCSSFSTAGARDRKWGTASKFREGQVEQVLDDLFFHFIEVARRLRPKIVIAENVKGLIIGKARGYVKEIFQAFGLAGYDVQLFLLNAASMGVPQARERTFFVARRRDLGLAPIRLSFSEPSIPVSAAIAGVKGDGRPLTAETAALWRKVKPGGCLGDVHPSGARWSTVLIRPDRPSPTVTGHAANELTRWDQPRYLSVAEIVRLQTFPDDYDFGDQKPHYVCGMSVPPRMMQRVAAEVRRQWLSTGSAP